MGPGYRLPSLCGGSQATTVYPGPFGDPGMRSGHEAIYFARNGFTVTAFDIAVPACNALRNAAQQLGVALDVQVGDALAVPKRF